MESLRECKRAHDEGLIDDDEYANAKGWFLFSHRIVAARETGVLRATDVEAVRRAMLEAISSGAKDVKCDVEALLRETMRGGGGLDADEDAMRDATVVVGREPVVLRETVGGRFNVKKSKAAQPTFMTKLEEAEKKKSDRGDDGQGAGGRSGESSAEENVEKRRDDDTDDKDEEEDAAPSAPPVPPMPPVPLPGMAAKKVSGTSMSGVAVAEDCLSVFNKLKMRSNGMQWATFQVEETEGSVLTDRTGDASSGDYQAFIDALPNDECRYAIYDYMYVNSEDCEFRKLVFIIWNPDGAKLKNKMLYASTKDFFKSRLSGIAVEIQATEYDEVSEAELRAHVAGMLTRK